MECLEVGNTNMDESYMRGMITKKKSLLYEVRL